MKYNIDEAIVILQRTPKVLKVLLDDLPKNWIYNNEGINTWSPFDVVGHLIQGEKTDWIDRIKIALNNDVNQTFKPFNRFAQFEDSKGKSLSKLLDEFETLRKNNLLYLKEIQILKDQFHYKAKHPALGIVTLKNLLATWVTHDLGHIAQIARVMAKQYKDQVGPWINYISVLKR